MPRGYGGAQTGLMSPWYGKAPWTGSLLDVQSSPLRRPGARAQRRTSSWWVTCCWPRTAVGTSGSISCVPPRSAALLPVLQDSATNIQAALSPDRTRIAFSSNRSGNFDLYVMDADGRTCGGLPPIGANEGEPSWTPDGRQIVYTATRGTATQIAIIPLQGGREAAADHQLRGGITLRPSHPMAGRSPLSRLGMATQEIYAMNR